MSISWVLLVPFFCYMKNTKFTNEEIELLSKDPRVKYIDQSSYLNPSQTASYKVKAWLSETADATCNNQTFTARIVIDSFQIT